jgi:hypothetical protein
MFRVELIKLTVVMRLNVITETSHCEAAALHFRRCMIGIFCSGFIVMIAALLTLALEFLFLF